jgi:chaperone required for assembly of F1-ATPase
VEWDSQLDKHRGIQPATMPLTTIASTAIDLIKSDPADARKTCLSFLPTDTTLFMTSNEDRILLKQQKQHYRPLLKWAHKYLSLELATTDNFVGKLKHPESTKQRLETIISRMVINLSCYCPIVVVLHISFHILLCCIYLHIYRIISL